jgi:tRNA1Val (adenine37-N6)-methyltransferase
MQEECDQQTALCREVGSSIDGRLLGAIIKPMAGERLVELGAGCGEVSLEVAQKEERVEIEGLEIQPQLVEIARLRIKKHHLSHRVHMVIGDVCSPPKSMIASSYDQLFCNPPFFKVGQGRIPPDKERAVARFEQRGTLADFIRCGQNLLREGGLFHLIHRPERLVEILSTLQTHSLSPHRLIPVYDRPDQPSVLVLITARKGGGAPMVVEKGWMIKE